MSRWIIGSVGIAALLTLVASDALTDRGSSALSNDSAAGSVEQLWVIDEFEPTPAELEDLRSLAEDTGVPLEQVVREQARSGKFAALVTRLESSTSNFVSARWGRDGTAPEIVFEGEPSETARSLIAEFPIAIDTKSSTAPPSGTRNRVLEEVYFSIWDAPGVTDASAVADPSTGLITVTYTGSATIASLQGRVDELAGGVPVHLVHESGSELGSLE